MGPKTSSLRKSSSSLPFSTSDFIELKNKNINIDSFETIAVIGRGTFGKVLLVKAKESTTMYAMKQIRKDLIVQMHQVDHIQSEREILGNLEFPFIIKMHYAFQTKKKLFFVFNYVKGGELFHHLSKCQYFDEERARFYSAELLVTLEYLHSKNVVYRDIKPENILLDDTGNIILTDFGLSKRLPLKSRTNSLCGTAEYMAPEIIKGESYGHSVDYWALGILIFEMLTGNVYYFISHHSMRKTKAKFFTEFLQSNWICRTQI